MYDEEEEDVIGFLLAANGSGDDFVPPSTITKAMKPTRVRAQYPRLRPFSSVSVPRNAVGRRRRCRRYGRFSTSASASRAAQNALCVDRCVSRGAVPQTVLQWLHRGAVRSAIPSTLTHS